MAKSSKLGFRFNQQFTDETATCMTVTDDIFVMLLTEEKFKAFTPKEICDAKKYTRCSCAYLSKAEHKSMRWLEKLTTMRNPLCSMGRARSQLKRFRASIPKERFSAQVDSDEKRR